MPHAPGAKASALSNLVVSGRAALHVRPDPILWPADREAPDDALRLAGGPAHVERVELLIREDGHPSHARSLHVSVADLRGWAAGQGGGLSAWGLGIGGLPLTVMVVAAALPVGANVFLFAQRYDTAQALTIAATGLTTVMALFTLSLVMTVMTWLNPLGG